MLNRFLPILAALSLLACGPKTGRAPLSDEALLDTVERYTVKYFTDFADPATGLARERNNDRNGNIVTIGGSGFGMMAVIAGAERAYFPREEGVARIAYDHLRDRQVELSLHDQGGSTPSNGVRSKEVAVVRCPGHAHEERPRHNVSRVVCHIGHRKRIPRTPRIAKRHMP